MKQQDSNAGCLSLGFALGFGSLLLVDKVLYYTMKIGVAPGQK
jgi:hypothetical protein